jgi:predicted nucleotidyltransferase
LNIPDADEDFIHCEFLNLKKQYSNINIGFAVITGSDSYGFKSENSDHDIRGVFYYNTKDQLKLFNNKQSNFNYTLKEKYDFVLTEVDNFIKNIVRMNCTTLEQLFSPFILYCNPPFEKLKNVVSNNLASKGIYESYHGMATFNYKHYIESESKATIKKWLYVIRAYLSGIYALKYGKVEQNILSLLAAKLVNYEQSQLIDDLVVMKLHNKEDSPVTDYKLLKEELLQLREELNHRLETHYKECKLPKESTEIFKDYLDYWIVDLRE